MMLAQRGGYLLALLGGLRPPVMRSAIRVAPIAAGNQSGDSWENAAPITALNLLVGLAGQFGAEIWLRADAGVYSLTSTISLTHAGVTIRGVDSSGNDMIAEMVGNRAAPWSAGRAKGIEAIRLNRGADDLTFFNLRFRNFGDGCLRMREAVRNFRAENIEGYNVARFIVNYGTVGVDASVTGAVIRNFRLHGFSKHGIQFRHRSTNILIEDGFLDSENQDGDFITVGVQADDYASNGIVRRVKVRNILNSGPGTYFNGDGFSGEHDNNNWRYEDCEAENISDGGIDHKGDNVVVLNFRARYCKRSVRLWGIAEVINLYSDTVRSRGGTGSTCHVFAMQGGKSFVRVRGGTFIQETTRAVFRVDDHGVIAVDQAALDGVQAPAGWTPFFSEADDQTDSYAVVWDHADTTAPAITSSLTFASNENLPATWRLAVTKAARLEKRGPDSAQVYFAGRDLNLYPQDFDKPGGAAADGSNILKFEIRAVDANGNVSPWYPVEITVNDVPDDPISPGEAVTVTGATGGFWYDIASRTSMWADAARTIQAEEGGPVKVMDDLTGFGNHLVFVDDREPILTTISGYRALLFDGRSVGRIGGVGGLRYPQFTSFFVQNRSKDAGGAIASLLFAGLRSKTATFSNGMYHLYARDGQTVVYRVNPNGNQTTPGTANSAPSGRAVVMSHRSTDGTLRTGHDANGMVLRLDGTDTPVATYPLADQQPLLGAAIDETGAFLTPFEGYFYGAAMLNVAVSDEIRFRIERQLGTSGGVPV